MALNLKQGSSLLDDDDDMSSDYIEASVPKSFLYRDYKDGGISSDDCYEEDNKEDRGEETLEKREPRVVKRANAAADNDDGADSDNSIDNGDGKEEEESKVTAESFLTVPSGDGYRMAEAGQLSPPIHSPNPHQHTAPVVIEKTETEKEIDNKLTMFLLRPLDKPKHREEDNIVESSPESLTENEVETSETNILAPTSSSINPTITSVIEDSRVDDDEVSKEGEGDDGDDDDFFESLVAPKDESDVEEEKPSGVEKKDQTTVEAVEEEKEMEEVEICKLPTANDETVDEKEERYERVEENIESTRTETIVKQGEGYDEFANQEPPLYLQSTETLDNAVYCLKDSNPPVTFVGAMTTSPADLVTSLPFQPTFPVSPPNVVLSIPPPVMNKTSFPEPPPADFRKRPRSNSVDSKWSDSYCRSGLPVKRKRHPFDGGEDEGASVAADKGENLEDTRFRLATGLPPRVSKESAKNSLFNDATRVSKTLMNKEITKSLIDNVRKTSLIIRVKMLRDQTEGLCSRQLVDLLFGENDEDVRLPSKEDRIKLKKMIDTELIVKRFTEYSKVFDCNSAELFRKDNETLEYICRQQIMSNPLLSAIDSASGIIPDVATLRTQQLSEDDAAEEMETVIRQQEILCPSNSTTQAMLHKDLCDIIHNAEGGEPAIRLTSRLSFLKRILSYKLGNMISVSKMINLVMFIFKQSLDMMKKKSRIQPSTADAPFVEPVDPIEEFGLCGISVEFLFGTISRSITNAIIRTCSSISELSIFLGIPIVLLQWPQEFTSSKEYKCLLTKSIFSFNAKTNTSITFILDELLKEEEEEALSPIKSTCYTNKTCTLNADELMTEQQKANIIRDAFHSQRYRDCAFGMFNLSGGGSPSSLAASRPPTVGPSLSVVYQNAMNIIDGNIKIVDSLFESVVDFVDTHKISIARLFNRVVRSVGVAATVYLVNRSVKKGNTKKKKNKERPTKTTSSFSKKQKECKLRSMMPLISAPSAFKNAAAEEYETDSEENLAYKQWSELHHHV